MEIALEISGGFAAIPKLNMPVTIETDKIDAHLADELKSLLEQTSFFDQPETVGTTKPGSADLMTYIVTVRDGGRAHTVRITDPITDPSLQILIDRIQAIGRLKRP